MARLVVTADAAADTDLILDYLERVAGRRVAENYSRQIRRLIERLVAMPESGPRRRALGPHVRIGIVSPYILIYDYAPSDDTLTLLRVVHGRRNITRDILGR